MKPMASFDCSFSHRRFDPRSMITNARVVRSEANGNTMKLTLQDIGQVASFAKAETEFTARVVPYPKSHSENKRDPSEVAEVCCPGVSAHAR